MNILESLQGISNYPITTAFAQRVALSHAIDLDDNYNASVANSSDYKLCEADIYQFLSEAPNVSQGGITYSLSEAERRAMRLKASQIREEVSGGSGSGVYGWQGEDL